MLLFTSLLCYPGPSCPSSPEFSLLDRRAARDWATCRCLTVPGLLPAVTQVPLAALERPVHICQRAKDCQGEHFGATVDVFGPRKCQKALSAAFAAKVKTAFGEW